MRYTDGTIRKHRKSKTGGWEWQAFCYRYDDDGSRHQVTKTLGIECVPPTDEERGGRSLPSGSGARKAQEALRAWVQDLRDEAKRREEAESADAAPAVSQMSVIDFVDRYWATRTITPVTAKGYEMLRKHLDHERLNKPVGKITADDVQGWIDDKRGKGTSDNTLNKALNQLKYAYRWGVRMGYLKTNPCDPIKPPKRAHRDPNPLDEENLTKIVRALETVREENPAQHVMVDAALIALNTGMRIGEVCGLAWDDVDGGADGRLAEGGQIHVNNVVTHPKGGRQLKPYPKNGDRRDIPMNPQLVRILKRRRAEAAEIAGEDLSGCYVIARDKTPGRFVSTEDVSRQWKLLVSLVGVKGVQGMAPHFHDLRHTFATRALTNGIDVVSVASILGHKNTSTTLRHYARWMPNANARAMERMGRLMSTGTS